MAEPSNCCACYIPLTGTVYYPLEMRFLIDFGPDTVKLGEMFRDCTGLLLLETHFICFSCHLALLQFYKFKKRAHETQKLLTRTESEELDDRPAEDLSQDLSKNIFLKNSPQEEKITKNEDGDFECSVCQGTFGRAKALQEHMLWKHSGKESFKCDICFLDFNEFSTLMKHVREQHQEKSYKCADCEVSYTNLKVLRNHITVKHLGKGRKRAEFTCNICVGQTFKRRTALRNHLFRVHGKGKILKPFGCKQCNSNFRTASELTAHESRAHSNERNFPCEICGKPFKTPKEARAHTEGVHATSADFCCDQCGKQFKTANSLNIHLKTHSEEAHFSCPQCPSTFRQSSTLFAHKRAHADEAKGTIFECEHCGKVVKSRTSLQHHLKLHTGPDLKCDQCNRVYKNRDSLKKHQLRGHGKRIRRYQCTICEKHLWNPYKIAAHVQKDHVEVVVGEKRPEDFVQKIFLKKFEEIPVTTGVNAE